MKLKIIFMIMLIIILVGCKEVPTDEVVSEEDKPVEAIEESPAGITAELSIVDVSLTAERTMDPEEISISVGTTVRWTNEGETPRNLKIYDMDIKELKDDDLIRSQNLYSGESFEYTFDKPGTYSVEDIYTYAIRGQITAEVVNLPGDEMGKVYVE